MWLFTNENLNEYRDCTSNCGIFRRFSNHPLPIPPVHGRNRKRTSSPLENVNKPSCRSNRELAGDGNNTFKHVYRIVFNRTTHDVHSLYRFRFTYVTPALLIKYLHVCVCINKQVTPNNNCAEKKNHLEFGVQYHCNTRTTILTFSTQLVFLKFLCYRFCILHSGVYRSSQEKIANTIANKRNNALRNVTDTIPE